MQAGYLVWAHTTRIRPRGGRPQSKPSSALGSLLSVRRTHKRRGVVMPRAPSVTLALRGLVKQYIRLHGVDALLPRRKEPLENWHVAAMYGVPDHTALDSCVVLWDAAPWMCLRAVVNTTRQMGARKADLLPPTPEEFDGSCIARSNITFVIGGQFVRDPSREQLLSMRDGDRVLMRPGASKNDFDGSAFGDKDVPLVFHPGDALAAATAIVDLELAVPVRGAARRRTPAFTADGSLRSMSHADADRMFNELAARALKADVAAGLSLHSGRVFKAVAMRANGESIATAQACCRWKTAPSAAVYSRLTLDEHAAIIEATMHAAISPTLSVSLRRDMQLDDDREIAGLRASLDRDQRRRATPPQPQPRASAAGGNTGDDRRPPSPVDAGDADTVHSDSEDEAPVQAGAPLAHARITKHRRVAVPFYSPRHGETHYAGRIARVLDGHARVAFLDVDGRSTQYDVNFDRLFDVDDG